MLTYNRRDFLRAATVGATTLVLPGCTNHADLHCSKPQAKRPNILFALADDWSWPHASIAGNKVIKTPIFDRVASEGVLFTHAFVTAPSCTPSRGSMLTGQYHWRLEEGCNLWSTLQAKFPIYTDILQKVGYHVGYTRKGWGPGRTEPGGRTTNPAGQQHKDFEQFLAARPQGKPFCFWFGSQDPHRTYRWQSGVTSGMKMEDVKVPACMPDSEVARTDICDYYWEVQRFDTEVGQLLEIIEKNGELDNTLVVISSDNGMPFPRCKSNLYDLGTNVPLAVRWPAVVKGGRVVEDFISLADLAPTFLEAAGLKPLGCMTGGSFLNILLSSRSGWVDKKRVKVFTGKERHAWVREDGLGYPCRAIRTKDYLYIINFKPDRWPAGNPECTDKYDPPRTYGDIDDSPTKLYMIEQKDNPLVKKLFELAFLRRQGEELYDLKKDPNQLNNVAYDANYAGIKNKLLSQLTNELRKTKDPRILGGADIFETYPYYGKTGNKK